MYTYNEFVFGQNLFLNKELNLRVHDFGLECRYNINGKKFQLDHPYHGGQVAGDNLSVILGHSITDDDNNPEYINTVRNKKEEDYIKDYNEFVKLLKEELLTIKGTNEKMGEEFDKTIDDLIEFLDSTSPGFYTVEISS